MAITKSERVEIRLTTSSISEERPDKGKDKAQPLLNCVEKILFQKF